MLKWYMNHTYRSKVMYSTYTKYAGRIDSGLSNIIHVRKSKRIISNWTFVQLIDLLIRSIVIRTYKDIFNIRLNLMIERYYDHKFNDQQTATKDTFMR